MKIINNPFAKYIKNAFNNYLLEHSYKKKSLKLDNTCEIKHVSFGNYVTVRAHAKIYGSSLNDCSYVNKYTYISRATIGKFCSIAQDVKVGLGGTHPTRDFISTHPAFYSNNREIQICFAKADIFEQYKQTIVGNDVWIGSNALIVDGLKIGNGAIVAVGSVVTNDVPDFAIVGGVPAKIIRYRFNPEEIEMINKSEWWNWSLEILEKYYSSFLNINDFKKLLERNDSTNSI